MLRPRFEPEHPHLRIGGVEEFVQPGRHVVGFRAVAETAGNHDVRNWADARYRSSWALRLG